MLTRTSVALMASLAMSCAVMSRDALFESGAWYTPDQARLVQRALSAHGYPVELTGVYDARTRAAVTGFQRSQGIEATGEMDAATARGLGLHPRDVTPMREEDWIQDDIQWHAWHDPGP